MTDPVPKAVCHVCDTPDGDHLDWCTPQAREQRPSKDLLNVVKGLRYRSDGVVDDFTADVEVDGMSLGIHQQDDIISLDVDEARALRDWLNKVVP